MVLSGPPGSRKTTIAVPLARELGLPLVAKDTVKEALMNSLQVADVERSRELGRASFAVLFALADTLIEVGTGLVLEANFSQGRSEGGLRPLVAGSRAVVVHCSASREVLVARYRERSRRRHPGHFDLERLEGGPSWLEPPASEPPLLGVPCLRVDTGVAWDLGALAAWTRDRLRADATR